MTNVKGETPLEHPRIGDLGALIKFVGKYISRHRFYYCSWNSTLKSYSAHLKKKLWHWKGAISQSFQGKYNIWGCPATSGFLSKNIENRPPNKLFLFTSLLTAKYWKFYRWGKIWRWVKKVKSGRIFCLDWLLNWTIGVRGSDLSGTIPPTAPN